jgi:hypothetical protein
MDLFDERSMRRQVMNCLSRECLYLFERGNSL